MTFADILKNLLLQGNTIEVWATCDIYGDKMIHVEKPRLWDGEWETEYSCTSLVIPGDMLPELHAENSPKKVKLTIEDYEQD